MRKRIIGLMAVVLVGVALDQIRAAEMILNGDFENNTASGIDYNMTNSEFNATVADATAFGTAEEIDIITGNSVEFPPQSGNWNLHIHTQRPSLSDKYDAFSLDLSSPVFAGSSYTLSFYAANYIGDVQVGLSNSATDFGTLIFSERPNPGAWTFFSTSFEAPSNASFLTVRNELSREVRTSVDNFSLVPVPEPSALTLLALGALGILAYGRRQTRRVA